MGLLFDGRASPGILAPARSLVCSTCLTTSAELVWKAETTTVDAASFRFTLASTSPLLSSSLV
jgi:hypothetical protein